MSTLLKVLTVYFNTSFLFVDLDGKTIMRSHLSTLIPRMIRAALKNHSCRYRIVAAGIDQDNQIISIASNRPRLRTRGHHAEERVIFSSPKSLRKIIILRVGSKGNLLPIDPCRMCQKLARNRGIMIESVRP